MHIWRARELPREPITGVWGRSPHTQRRSRGRVPGGGSGAIPPEADEVFVFKILIMVVLWNRADH